MDSSTFFMLMGFFFAAYSVIANDSLQTLGTFLASNKKRFKWYVLALVASLVMIAVLGYGWYSNDGDISYGRLSDKGIPMPEEFTIWHALAPLSLLVLTRFGIPVSTTFLVLSVFGTGVFIQKMLVKSILGYAVAAIAAYAIWYVLSKYLNEVKKPSEKNRRFWVVAQWFATGYLWSVWLMHDMANIAVFLPRQLDFTSLLMVLGVLTAIMFYIFWRSGGPIQKVVLAKTGTQFIRSATIIDIVYATILFIFKEVNSIPMSTTWVFVGLLAGRELAVMRQFDSVSKARKVFPMVAKDFAKVMFGLIVSLILALSVAYFA